MSNRKNEVTAVDLAVVIESAINLHQTHGRPLIICAQQACDEYGVDRLLTGLLTLAMHGTFDECRSWARAIREAATATPTPPEPHPSR